MAEMRRPGLEIVARNCYFSAGLWRTKSSGNINFGYELMMIAVD